MTDLWLWLLTGNHLDTYNVVACAITHIPAAIWAARLPEEKL